MKYWLLFLLVFPLAACSTVQPQPEDAPQIKASTSSLPDLGEAPELQNEVWLNTDAPLHLKNLRGSVVLIDMWTFG